MKTFLIVRGVDTQFKRTFVEGLMKILNPDVNHTRAIRISISDQVEDWDDDSDVRAAELDCWNLLKKVLGGNHDEEFIVVDNESLLPEQWEILNELARDICIPVSSVGYDIISPENFISDEMLERKNLQEENCALFIAAIPKYHCVKTDEEIHQELLTLRNNLNQKGD